MPRSISYPSKGVAMNKIPTSLVLGMAAMLAACGGEKSETSVQTIEFSSSSSLQPTKKVEADPPYIVQEACTFWLVTPNGTVSTTSERGSGISGNATLNMGDYQMRLSECQLIANPQNLRVY